MDIVPLHGKNPFQVLFYKSEKQGTLKLWTFNEKVRLASLWIYVRKYWKDVFIFITIIIYLFIKTYLALILSYQGHENRLMSRVGWSLTFDSMSHEFKSSNAFSSKTPVLIATLLHINTSGVRGIIFYSNLFCLLNKIATMPIYDKNTLKIFCSIMEKKETSKLGTNHWWLETPPNLFT